MTLQVQVERPRLTSFARMREMLKDWYICPICNKTSQLFAVNEEVMMNGKVFKQYFLSCYDLVPDHLGRPKMSKQHHWVPSLKYLMPVTNILHTCNMELFLSVETKQKNGRIAQRLMQRSDSYVSNFIGFLSSFLSSTGGSSGTVLNAASSIYSYLSSTNITTTTVTAVSGLDNAWSSYISLSANAGTGGLGNGMAVGTGTTANTPQTGALASPIGNGTGAGELQYQATTMGPGAISGSTTSTLESRAFGNGSGGTVTINEVGLFGLNFPGTTTGYPSLIIRDVLATSVSVANGVTATATYTISITTS